MTWAQMYWPAGLVDIKLAGVPGVTRVTFVVSGKGRGGDAFQERCQTRHSASRHAANIAGELCLNIGMYSSAS
jgi:hypothetical protein